ncbi:MFS general substrate transporter [Dendrothele bispora CBS 962.96]|uniref:MFS general substrate transporter n=1 Tax=Dendrothele bispora (strain CBS 962.96) TaxID=1314807 RepID=A0A4V4HFJ5_DENBC|nr:MFS general substrate transporter [Dendrothele bispora CBS 962.96]
MSNIDQTIQARTTYCESAEFGGTEERKKLEKKLLMKIDLRMSILYILNYIDRNNAGAARLKGFEEDLKLQGQEFATLLSILYVGYIPMQVPSNMLLNKIGKPSIYLPVGMAIWGTISILTGITHNFVGALTRFFLGFVEAAFYPGALFLLSKWYKKDEIGLHTAMLTCGSIISNGFVALSFNAYFPTLTATLGYSETITLWLCAPPWVLTARSVICRDRWVRDCDFDASVGSEQTSDLDRFINAFSQLGNVVGSYIWDKFWGPLYARSYGICIATSGVAIIVVLFFRWHLARLNRKMEQEQEQSGDEKDVGRSGFRYVL